MEGFATLDICGLTTVFLELVSYLQATCEGLEGGGGVNSVASVEQTLFKKIKEYHHKKKTQFKPNLIKDFFY